MTRTRSPPRRAALRRRAWSTSIRRIAGLPHGLHQWAINQVISHALDHWPELTERLREAHRLCAQHGWHAPIVEQPQYSLLVRDVEEAVEPAVAETGMGLVVWSPLAGGALTGKYDAGIPEGSRGASTQWLDGYLTDEGLERLRAFSGLAAEAGCRPSQLALAWLLRCGTVSSVITGATRADQVEENLAAAELEVDDALAARLDALFPGPRA